MTKYILHGGYERRDNETNDTFYKELTRTVPEDGLVLLVYFASDSEDVEEAYEEQTQRMGKIAGKDLRFELAREDIFLDQVMRADAVHFRGGNTAKLLETLRHYPDLTGLLKEKEVVSGSSAGAYALCKYGTAHSEQRMREGLGILPLRVVCHYESEDLPPSQESYSELVKTASELKLILLKDCEWQVFEQ